MDSKPLDSEMKRLEVSGVSSVKSTNQSFVPVCIPQGYSQWASPFVRAYAEGLAERDISSETWLTFLDKLNSAISRSSTATVVTSFGAIVSSIPFPPAMVGGTVLLMGSEGADYTRSKIKVKHFLKKANDEIFFSRGLVCKIYETRAVLKELDVPQAEGLSHEELLERAKAHADKEVPLDKAARLQKALQPFKGHTQTLVYYDEAKPKKTMQGFVRRADLFVARQQNKLVHRSQKNAAKKLLKAEERGDQKKLDKEFRKYAESTGHTVQGAPPAKPDGTMKKVVHFLIATQWLTVTALEGGALPSMDSMLIERNEDELSDLDEDHDEDKAPAYEKTETVPTA